MNVAELLWSSPDPDSPALVDRSRTPDLALTTGELQTRALRVAAGLHARGIARHERVGVLASNCAEFYDVMFGAPAGGMVFVPLNTRLPLDTQSYIVDDADLRLVVVDEEHLARVPDHVPHVVIGSAEWQELASTEPLTAPVAVADDDVAVHIYTSGSTGRPKGVLLTHRNITFTVLEYGAQRVEGAPGGPEHAVLDAEP